MAARTDTAITPDHASLADTSKDHAAKTDPLASSLSEADAEVIRAIRNLRYGSVEITIHDSRIVQIERKEKRRFERSQRWS
jgi:hypothetical protein